MNQMQRKNRLYVQLEHLEKIGIIRDDFYVQGDMPGLRWHFTTVAHGQSRAFNTNEMECFVMGAFAVWDKKL
jgi:hypothetical protein